MANEIVLTSREKDRQGGRKGLVGGREGGRVRKMEEKRMDVLKHATEGKRQTGYEVRE